MRGTPPCTQRTKPLTLPRSRPCCLGLTVVVAYQILQTVSQSYREGDPWCGCQETQTLQRLATALQQHRVQELQGTHFPGRGRSKYPSVLSHSKISYAHHKQPGGQRPSLSRSQWHAIGAWLRCPKPAATLFRRSVHLLHAYDRPGGARSSSVALRRGYQAQHGLFPAFSLAKESLTKQGKIGDSGLLVDLLTILQCHTAVWHHHPLDNSDSPRCGTAHLTASTRRRATLGPPCRSCPGTLECHVWMLHCELVHVACRTVLGHASVPGFCQDSEPAGGGKAMPLADWTT